MARRTSTDDTPRERVGDSGHTMLEVVIVLVVGTVLLLTFGSMIIGAQGAYNEGMVAANADSTATRVLRQAVSELRDAQLSSITLSQPTNAPSISYTKITGWSGTAPTTSATQTLSFASGALSLNGQVIVDGLADVFFDLDVSVLTITVRVSATTATRGVERVISRQLVANLSL